MIEASNILAHDDPFNLARFINAQEGVYNKVLVELRERKRSQWMWYVFCYSDETNREETREGLLVISAIFLAYGVAGLIHGYGFLAVFAAAVAGRQNVAKGNSYHQKPYQFATQLEEILLSLLLLALGGFIATSNLDFLSVDSLVAASILLLLVRPLSGMFSLKGLRFRKIEKQAISLGIRGFGSFYYLAYAQNQGNFDNVNVL